MTSLNSNSNVVQNTLESLSLADLNKKYFELRDKTDAASKKEFQEVENEMVRRLDAEKNQSNASNPEKTSKEKLDEFFKDKKTKNRSKEKKNELYNLILEEIKKAKTPDEETKKQVDSKQSEIDRLTALLDEEKKSTHEMLTDTPSLKEYFSLERRRRAGMLKKFDTFKDDTKNYPKNLLIYAMGITDSKLFWVRQKLKRGRITVAWKWKEDDIVKNLNTMLDKTRTDSNDSKRKAAIKKALYKELQLALESHKEKLIKQNSLPDYK
jgi:predicted RNase H-like nuclease (RuvC/YqgF family)